MARTEEGYWKTAAILANALRARDQRSLLISGVCRGAGTTTVALQVAQALCSRCEVRPLVVELDFWRPRFVKRLKLDPYRTLEEVARGSAQLPEAVQKLPNGVHVLAACAKRCPPQKQLAPLMTEILEYAATTVDLVLVDAPPPTEYGAILSVGAVIPRMLLVVRAGRSSDKALARFQQSVHQGGIEIVGTVLNREKRFVPGWIERLFLS